MKAIFKSLLIIFGITGIYSCQNQDFDYKKEVEKILQKNLTKYEVPGASASIILPDKELILVSSGISHDTVEINPNMLFAIGSITKNFISTLTLKLCEEEQISLEDSIYNWLPEYKYIDSTITIRQLLQHTSGLYMFWDNQELWDDMIQYREKVFTPEEVISYIKEPYFAPGKGWRYSNTNYLLLAMIIKEITQSNLSTQFEKYFWNPLNMNNVYLSVEQEIPKKMAHVWSDNFEFNDSIRDVTSLPRMSHESITYGSSGLFMTPENLAKWTDCLFSGKIISESSLKEMLDFVNASAFTTDYGLGIFKIDNNITNGNLAYGHGGGNIGTSSYMIYLPEYEVSIAISINMMHDKCPDRILEDIIKITVKKIELDKKK